MSAEATGRTYKIKSIVYGLLAVLMMCAIFTFSSQNGTRSSSLSYSIAWALAQVISALQGASSTISVSDLADALEFPIRKLAHVTEYAILAGLVSACTLNLQEVKQKRNIWNYPTYTSIAIAICVIYAATDELHQTIIPGRCGQAIDVVVDSIGIIIGAVIVATCHRYFKEKRQTRKHSNR